MRNLYLVSTAKFDCYVVAKDTEYAKAAFENWLVINNYGAHMDREVVNIKLIAKEGVKPKDNVIFCIDKLIIDNMVDKSEVDSIM